jgi:competence protein ComEA
VDKKIRYLWWGVLGLLFVIAIGKFILPVKTPIQVESSPVNREIVVYVTGAVKHPGLICLPIDARLDDALKKAELKEDADIEALNPALKLKDGQKVIVPSIPLPNTDNQTASTVQVTSKLVNINSAGLGELDTIPGVGPALAQRIIDFREQNGLFSSPEEIQNVSGIGPKTYEKMAGYITVGF